MTTEELQQLARQFGSVVVLKDDKPSFVFLTFEKYRDLLGDEEKEVTVNHFSSRGPESLGNTRDPRRARMGMSFDSPNGLNLSKSEHEVMEKLNREVMALKDEIRTKEEQEYY